MANPYDIQFLEGLIGQEETQRLEFKSSRDLLDDNPQKRGKFISAKLSPTVSAFLNTDGGLLVVGVEEKNGIAESLSGGVPSTLVSRDQLRSAICDRIQPAVANYVSVSSLEVGRSPESERLLAFVVEVKPGTTAYQADDKKYYVRRSGESEAMEDKDVRLRMLAGDKPRLNVSLRHRIVKGGGISYISGVDWDLRLENVGVRTVPRAIVHPVVYPSGLSELGNNIVNTYNRILQTTFENHGIDLNALLPGMSFSIPSLFSISSLTFTECRDISAVNIFADVTVHVDDGLPVELRNYDLMAVLRPIIESGWYTSTDLAE